LKLLVHVTVFLLVTLLMLVKTLC